MATHSYNVKVRLRSGGAKVDPGRIRQFINTEPGIIRDLMQRADRAANYQRANVGRKTGLLAGTIRTQLTTAKGGPAAQAIAGRQGVTPYLGYHVFGTGPHVITPSRAKALRFASGSGIVFATRVNHPGNRANRFIQESLAAARG